MGLPELLNAANPDFARLGWESGRERDYPILRPAGPGVPGAATQWVVGATGIRYEIRGRIGGGGYAHVWAAAHKDGMRAIKIAKNRRDHLSAATAALAGLADLRMRNERQAYEIYAEFTGITRMFDYGPVRDRSDPTETQEEFIVLPWISHLSLDDLLKHRMEITNQRCGLELDDAWAFARTYAEDLCRYHEAGIVHRDLSPANTFVTPNGVIIADLGLSFSPEFNSGKAQPDVQPTPSPLVGRHV